MDAMGFPNPCREPRAVPRGDDWEVLAWRGKSVDTVTLFGASYTISQTQNSDCLGSTAPIVRGKSTYSSAPSISPCSTVESIRAANSATESVTWRKAGSIACPVTAGAVYRSLSP